MAKETFPRHESELDEFGEINWPVKEVRFNRKNGIVIVDVDEPGLTERLIDQPALSEFGQLGFEPKEGLHMTVTGYENGAQILEALKPLTPQQQDELLLEVVTMAENTNWSWWPTGKLQYFSGRKKKGLKIISRVECPGFNQFYDGLGQLMPNARFKFYPPHITLLKQPGVEEYRPAPLSVGGVALSRPVLSLNYPTFEG